MKRLIVTADDVGLHAGMTEGAIRAHQQGIVTACSISANGVAFDDAVSRLKEIRSLEVGVHLTLVEERALTTGQSMPANYIRFVFSRKDVESELRAQIERVLSTGLPVTHLNGHQHLHAWPSVFALVERLAREYGIRYIRRVNDHGGKATLGRRSSIALLNLVSRRGTNDRTIGILEAGHLKEVETLLDHVDGLTELVTHPGVAVRGYEHWRYDWEGETRALTDPGLPAALARRGISLVAPSAV